MRRASVVIAFPSLDRARDVRTAVAARAAPIAVFLAKTTHPSPRLSPVSIERGRAKPRFSSQNARISRHVKLDAADLSEPAPRARLRDRHPLSGVHLGLPDDRPAGFRRDPDHLRSRCELRRAEIAEV